MALTFTCSECGFKIKPATDGERCPVCGYNPYRTDD
jgi:rubrerythrin